MENADSPGSSSHTQVLTRMQQEENLTCSRVEVKDLCTRLRLLLPSGHSTDTGCSARNRSPPASLPSPPSASSLQWIRTDTAILNTSLVVDKLKDLNFLFQ